jgi:hypothetical protein
MTRQEIDKQIEGIQREDVSQEEKNRRIAFLNKTYSDYETRTAEEAKKNQERAETDLKSRLKTSYMSNPVATEEDFERDYPQLKSEFLRAETMKKDEAARQSMANSFRSKF